MRKNICNFTFWDESHQRDRLNVLLLQNNKSHKNEGQTYKKTPKPSQSNKFQPLILVLKHKNKNNQPTFNHFSKIIDKIYDFTKTTILFGYNSPDRLVIIYRRNKF